MVAVTIFSMGVLALVGLQSAMIKNSSDNRYRAEAQLIAQTHIANMMAYGADAATYIAQVDKDKIKTQLPNGALTFSALTNSMVTVSVAWQVPGGNRHQVNASSYLFEAGMSLVELLVGLLIGLVATLAISNLFSGFEARKRVIAGGADAQSSGVLAMYYMQRDAQNAGFGLPLYNSSDPSPLLCPMDTSINQAGVVINLSPVVIVDGGAGNDTLRIRYGNPASGGASLRATGNMAAPTLDGRLIGCQENDVVLFHQTPDNPNCSMARLQKLNPDRAINALSELNTMPTERPVTDLNGADWVSWY
ncbi:conserved hypothetical protein [Ricinus communis]|uniref:Uncharacterized protein n=1 Tax=Ricinus communis TaxID=3988 RepID=B9T9H6_RICCO|nr:conserved hypothetical protein [Ricinus communis]